MSIGKLYGILIARIEEEDTEMEELSGFRPGQSCVDNIFTIKQLAEKRLARGLELHATFIGLLEVIETDLHQPSSSPRKSNRKKSTSPSALATNKMYDGVDHHIKPKCVVTEEPAQKRLRFRYECEGRSAGSIPGANSTPENKTFPTIQIQGYKGKAIVVVSCVTKDEPYRPHPHKLVGREGCKKGVCTVQVSEETMTVSFQNLGIQCVKKKDIEEALKTREEVRVDPFRTGFSHRNQPASIDLNAVRLCFQVFLQEHRGKYIHLQPVVSTPIYDKKAMCDLIIVTLSDCVCPVDGGNKDLILLCEKVAKEDIQIRFFEEKNNELIWEDYAEFQPSQVHKQTAICFRPPKYKTLAIIEPVKMFVQLKRPSDNATSTPVPFQMVALGGKRRAEHSDTNQNKRILLDLHKETKNSPIPDMYRMNIAPNISPMNPNVKDEPDMSPPPFLMDQQYPIYPQLHFQNMPSTSQQLPSLDVAWGGQPSSYAIPSLPHMANIPNIPMIPESTMTFTDMDSLKQITINSDDLPPINNMSLSDITNQPDGMTDSLDRLANNEVDKHLAPH